MERYDYSAAGRFALWDTTPKTSRALVRRLEQLLAPYAGASIEADVEDLFPSDDTALVALTSVLDKLVARGRPTLVDLDLETHVLRGLEGVETVPLEVETHGRLVGRGFRESSVASRDLLEAAARLFDRSPSAESARRASAFPLHEDLEGISSEEERTVAAAIGRVLGPEVQAALVRQPLLSDLVGEEPEGLVATRPDMALAAGPVRWVVEVDGEQHADQKAQDDLRDNALRDAGWRVVRLSAETARRDADSWVRDTLVGGATDQEREHLAAMREPLFDLTAQADQIAYATIVRPHLVHRALRGLVLALSFDLIPRHTERPVRVLALEEDVPVVAEAFRQLFQLWGKLGVIAPDVPPPPTVELDVVGGGGLAPIPHPNLLVRHLDAPEGRYDLSVSHAHTLQSGQTGVREEAAGAVADRRIRLRSTRSFRDRRALPWSRRLTYDLDDLERALRSQQTDTPLPIPEAKYDALRFFLQLLFRKGDFWDGQARVVARLLQDRPAVALLPTGGGKSLTYQFSGLLLPGVTLVVDPLVALMEDQVENLLRLGIDRVGAVSSLLDAATKEDMLGQVERGEAAFVFVAPERLQMPDFRSRLRALTAKIPISLAVIDEVHCVSEWGHDFRPSYLHMGRNLRRYATPAGAAPPTLVGLTGTASFAVLTDIQVELDVRDEDAVVLPESFDRKELTFHVEVVPATEKAAALRTLREGLPRVFQTNPQRFFELRGDRTRAGIVFCPHVNGSLGVVDVAGRLGHGHYFAGSKPKKDGWKDRTADEWKQHKIRTQRAFKYDAVQELVATNSFGMGIDKPNVAYTIHYSIPHSVEAFYQEAGRAGRNGVERSAHCFVLYSDDNAAVAEAVLNETDHRAAADLLDSVKWPNRGDLLHQLWFLLNSYQDREQEKADTLDFWSDRLRPDVAGLPEGAVNTVTVGFGKREATERAIFRLVLLGVVEDYAVDWRLRSFHVRVRVASPETIQAALADYLRQYKFEAYARQLTDDLPLSDAEETLEIALGRLLDFVYDEVVAKRKQALATMAELCRSFASDETFREAVLAYLQDSEFTPVLKEWIYRSFDEVGVGAILEVLDGVTTLDEAKRLVGTTRRMLDEAPGHVALRTLSACARIRSVVESEDGALAEALAALRASLADPTLQDPSAVALTLLDEAERYRPAMARPFLHELLRAAGSPELARAYRSVRGRWPDDEEAARGLATLYTAGIAGTVRHHPFLAGLPA